MRETYDSMHAHARLVAPALLARRRPRGGDGRGAALPERADPRLPPLDRPARDGGQPGPPGDPPAVAALVRRARPLRGHRDGRAAAPPRRPDPGRPRARG